MKHYLVTVPDDGRHYEIYTPIEDGIRGVVTCAECRFSKEKAWSFSDEQWLVCSKIAFAEVQNDHFCSWGEPEQPFAE